MKSTDGRGSRAAKVFAALSFALCAQTPSGLPEAPAFEARLRDAPKLGAEEPDPDGLVLFTTTAAEIPLRNVPAVFGVPFGREKGPTSLDAFDLVDAKGVVVPFQWRPLVRWDAPRETASARLRFAQIAVVVDAEPFERARYVLRRRPDDPASRLVQEKNAGAKVEASHVRVAFDAPSVANIPTFLIPTTPGAELCLVRFGDVEHARLKIEGDLGAGPTTPIFDAPVVEENGATRVVVRRRARFGDLAITARLHFHAGSNVVDCDVRLENTAAYGRFDQKLPIGIRTFRRLACVVETPFDGAATPVFLDSVAAAARAPLEEGATVALRTRSDPPRRGFGPLPIGELHRSEMREVVAYDAAHAGAAGVVGSRAAVAVAIDRAAEAAPKEVRVGRDFVAAVLWPRAESDAAYGLDGGRFKTHRVAFVFAPGADESSARASLRNEVERLRRPVRGGVRPETLRATGATPGLFVERRAWGDGAAQRFERFFDLLIDDDAADPFPGKERVGLRRFLARGGTYGGMNPYGWENDGDLPWADGYCNLHYDWPLHPILGYLRTLDPRFMDAAAPLAAWRRDMGQNHALDEREWWRGAPFYEKGDRHGNGSPGQASHFWLRGLSLWYATTGDEGAYEAAREGLDFALRNAPGDWTGWWGSRIPGWTVRALVDAGALLGAPTAFAEARRGVLRFAEFERSTGGHGCVLNPSGGRTSPWMECIFFNAACDYVAATGDASVLPFLKRQRSFLSRAALVEDGVAVPHSFSHWAPTGGTEPSVHLVWPLIESFTWSAVLEIDGSDDARARRLFDALTCHWQAVPGTSLDAPCSPLTFRPAMFPGTETKALGNVLLWGTPHLALRAR